MTAKMMSPPNFTSGCSKYVRSFTQKPNTKEVSVVRRLMESAYLRLSGLQTTEWRGQERKKLAKSRRGRSTEAPYIVFSKIRGRGKPCSFISNLNIVGSPSPPGLVTLKCLFYFAFNIVSLKCEPSPTNCMTSFMNGENTNGLSLTHYRPKLPE